eukprot:PhM_4_TR15799/c0_g1_i1/m.43732
MIHNYLQTIQQVRIVVVITLLLLVCIASCDAATVVTKVCSASYNTNCPQDGTCETTPNSVGTTSYGKSSVYASLNKRIYFVDEYTSDPNSRRLRYFDVASQQITTVIGDGVCSTSSVLGSGLHLALYDENALFIADPDYHIIRKVTLTTHAEVVWLGTHNFAGSDTGTVRSASKTTSPDYPAVVGDTLYYFSSALYKIFKVGLGTDDVVSEFVSWTSPMNGVASMDSMLFFIKATGNDNIFVVDVPTGTGHTLPGTMPSGTGPGYVLADCARARLYIAGTTSNKVLEYKFSDSSFSDLVGGGTLTSSTDTPSDYQFSFSNGRSIAIDDTYLWINDGSGVLTSFNLGSTQQQECRRGTNRICGRQTEASPVSTCRQADGTSCINAKFGPLKSIAYSSASNNFYVTEPNINSVRVFPVASNTVDRTLSTFYGAATCVDAVAGSPDQFTKPSAVLATSELLFISDTGNHVIKTHRFTTSTVSIFYGQFGSTAFAINASNIPHTDSEATIDSPTVMTTIDDKGIYVSESGLSRIKRIIPVTTNGTTLNYIVPVFQASNPIVALVGTRARLYYIISGEHCVKYFLRIQGAPVETLLGVCDTPSASISLTSFNTPVGLAMDCGRSRLYVADQQVHRVASIDLSTLPYEAKNFIGGPSPTQPSDFQPNAQDFMIYEPEGLLVADKMLWVVTARGVVAARLVPFGTYQSCSFTYTATPTETLSSTATLTNVDTATESESDILTETKTASLRFTETDTLSDLKTKSASESESSSASESETSTAGTLSSTESESESESESETPTESESE